MISSTNVPPKLQCDKNNDLLDKVLIQHPEFMKQKAGCLDLL
jgi:hypothetical protein